MKKERLFETLTFKDEHNYDELGMILSNHIDIIHNGHVAISLLELDDLINDIIEWHNEKSKRLKL